jgi:hypothetical protein
MRARAALVFHPVAVGRRAPADERFEAEANRIGAELGEKRDEVELDVDEQCPAR